MKKQLALISGILLFITAAAISMPVFAQESQCQPIYGGGETCTQTGNVTIDKKVKKANSNEFVDNIQTSDPFEVKYAPGAEVPFELWVQNTSNKAIDKVTVRDIFPQELTFTAGSGTYNPSNRTFTVEIARLNANERRKIDVKARVAQRDRIQSPCFINQSTVTVADKTNQDNAQVCIQTTQPTTGPGTPTPTLRPGEPTPTQVPGQPGTENKGGQPGTTTQGGQPGTGTQNQPGTQGQPGTQAGGQPTETKGGLKVFPSPQVQQTPKTGPEMLALAGLIPAGALGQFLRRKTKLS